MSISTETIVHGDEGRVSKAERLGLASPITEVTDKRTEAEHLSDKLDAALEHFGYTIHPKAQETPGLTMAEYISLRQLVFANGQLIPILMQGDMLIDGRHRLMACFDNGYSPKVRQLHDAADLETVIYDAEARRHQTKSQMAAFTVLFYEEKVRELTAAGEGARKAGVPQYGDRTEVSPSTFVSQKAGVGIATAKVAVALLNAGRVDLLIDVRDGAISSLEKAYHQYLDEIKGAENKQDAGVVALNTRLAKVGAAIQTLSNEVEKLSSLTYAVEENVDLDELIEAVTAFSNLYAGNAQVISKTLVPAGYEDSEREQRAAWMKEHAHLAPSEWAQAYRDAFVE